MEAKALGNKWIRSLSGAQKKQEKEKERDRALESLREGVSCVLLSLLNGCEGGRAGRAMEAVAAGVAALVESDSQLAELLLKLGFVDLGDRIPYSKDELRKVEKLAVRFQHMSNKRCQRGGQNLFSVDLVCPKYGLDHPADYVLLSLEVIIYRI